MRTMKQPSSMRRALNWTSEVENAYRYQIAGYRDEIEYYSIQPEQVEKWTTSGFVKKLRRKDGYFYYFDQARECSDKDVKKCKLYTYE
ncbi:Meiosis expressed protein 1 [Fasciola gigantica]|uniref:Meiosis expressed protein 1 n=1 Tax=Fasciola gigantica TaxID=46835 RepID=A0A504YJI8_FASGI|nr:Meiosis expressed protein 1 [Fasciola gigantica]